MLSLSYPKALLSCFLFSLMRSENPRKHRSTQRASTAVAEAFSSPRSLSPLRRRPGHGSPNLGNSPEYPKGWLEENKSRSDSDDASEASETSIYSSTMEESSVSEHLNELQQENADLKLTLEALRAENERLKTESKANSRQTRIVLENFEGEFSGHADAADGLAMALLDGDEEAMEKFCDDLEDDACPVEPTVSFREALRDRAVWLIGLLIFQSASGLILAHNEQLLEKHPVSKYMLSQQRRSPFDTARLSQHKNHLQYPISTSQSYFFSPCWSAPEATLVIKAVCVSFVASPWALSIAKRKLNSWYASSKWPLRSVVWSVLPDSVERQYSQPLCRKLWRLLLRCFSLSFPLFVWERYYRSV